MKTNRLAKKFETDGDIESNQSSGLSTVLTPELLRDLLRGIDLGMIALLGAGIYFVRVHPLEPHRLGEYVAALAAALVLLSLTGQAFGLYRPEVVFERRLRLGRSLAAWALTFAILLTAAFALKISDEYSRVWALSWFLTGTSALGLMRMVTSAQIGRLRSSGLFSSQTVVIGIGPQAEKLAQSLNRSDTIETNFLGFVDDGSGGSDEASAADNVIGGMDTLMAMIRDGRVDQVIIALPSQDSDRIREVAYRLALTPVTVCLSPNVSYFDFPGRAYVHLANVPMLQLYSRPISGWARILKGLEDRILAASFLVALSPLMLLIAAAIRIESPGPVLFRQQRYGFNNNLIEVFKFRTMFDHLTDTSAEQLTTRDDARVTKVGRILRRTSLDELPQFFNVLRGEMSIVGPRPHAVAAKAAGQLYNEAVDQYAARHKVKPGITGWAQINGWRGETDTLEKLQRRIDCDLYYIDNWSLWLDLMIILRTAVIIIGDREAY
jgi:Undecaprenyl-phosphate glucose phosphotransferase